MWQSTPPEQRVFETKEHLRSLEIKEDCVCFVLRGNEERMYLNINCPKCPRGDQPLQSCVEEFPPCQFQA